jgi:hypothetical protein
MSAKLLKLYDTGAKEAWDCARRIVCNNAGLSIYDLEEIFGTSCTAEIFMTFTAEEAIRRIKAFDKAQENNTPITY